MRWNSFPPHPGHRQATSSVLYTTSCKHSLVLVWMGEIIGRNMLSWLKLLIKLLLLHPVGCLYYYIISLKHSCFYISIYLSIYIYSSSFETKKLHLVKTRIYIYILHIILTTKSHSFLTQINRLYFVKESEFVFCETGNEFSNIVYINFRLHHREASENTIVTFCVRIWRNQYLFLSFQQCLNTKP